jgi:hypothetical protein
VELNAPVGDLRSPALTLGYAALWNKKGDRGEEASRSPCAGARLHAPPGSILRNVAHRAARCQLFQGKSRAELHHPCIVLQEKGAKGAERKQSGSRLHPADCPSQISKSAFAERLTVDLPIDDASCAGQASVRGLCHGIIRVGACEGLTGSPGPARQTRHRKIRFPPPVPGQAEGSRFDHVPPIHRSYHQGPLLLKISAPM